MSPASGELEFALIVASLGFKPLPASAPSFSRRVSGPTLWCSRFPSPKLEGTHSPRGFSEAPLTHLEWEPPWRGECTSTQSDGNSPPISCLYQPHFCPLLYKMHSLKVCKEPIVKHSYRFKLEDTCMIPAQKGNNHFNCSIFFVNHLRLF